MKSIKNIEMQVLACVCKHQSFTKAASEMKLSQAQLSKYISSLESKLGIILIERSVRPVILTSLGEAVYPYIDNCILANEELSGFIEKNQRIDEGTVNIYSPSGMQYVLAKYLLPSLHKTDKKINITMTTWNQADDEISNGLNFDNNCDILISYAPPKNENLIARKLRTIRMNIFSTDELHNKHPIRTINDISQVPFILQKPLLSHNGINYISLTDANTGEIKNVVISGDYTFDNALTAINASRSGLGYLLMSSYLLDSADELKPRLPDNYIIEIPCYIIYRRRINQPPRIQEVINHIFKYFNNHD